jgi:predicted NBD/HSP70 family sugar kinase
MTHGFLKRNQVNRINRTLVLKLIREHQSVSRIDIARKTGLHKSSVTTIVKSLLEEDLILESGNREAARAGGRRPTLLTLNAAARDVIGVEIQPSLTRIALADFNGNIRRQWNLKRPRDPQQCIRHIGNTVRGIVAEYGGPDRFEGLGISCPGIIDSDEGILIYSSNLEWRDVSIVSLLTSLIRIPAAMDNDTFLCALAERWYGPAETTSRMQEFAFVNVTEGLGVGLIINGELHRGCHSGSHNFGHMTIDVNGPACRCGNRGCWEAFASNHATIERYRRLIGRRSKLPPRGAITIDDILDRARAGEKDATYALKITAAYLGIGIANMVNGLNLPVFVIGGEISSAWSLIEDDLMASLGKWAFKEYLENVSIRPTALGQQSALMGSIAKALSARFAIPIRSGKHLGGRVIVSR